LSERYRVHVAGFAHEDRTLAAVEGIRPTCASAYLERLRPRELPLRSLQLLAGNSLTSSYYHRRSLRNYVRTLNREVRFAATVAFTSAMAPYAPEGVPLLLDMVDVDSEKWLDYARRRSPHWLFRIEAGRLQREERRWTARAASVVLTTERECSILLATTPRSRVRAVENGVDFSYCDPARTPSLPELAGRPYLVMVGSMNYYPNADGAIWFAKEVFAPLHKQLPDLEFLIVGHRPPRAVRDLAALPGVSVVGYVPDVRPYLSDALAAVCPLRIARGIQNKVLEAVAMGKPVLASIEIGETFGGREPVGLRSCRTPADYHRNILELASQPPRMDATIRNAAMQRFSWQRNLEVLDEELQFVMHSGVGALA
jgi:sugar transferase (PEP-CTERM/EpsH1 system associated)